MKLTGARDVDDLPFDRAERRERWRHRGTSIGLRGRGSRGLAVLGHPFFHYLVVLRVAVAVAQVAVVQRLLLRVGAGGDRGRQKCHTHLHNGTSG